MAKTNARLTWLAPGVIDANYPITAYKVVIYEEGEQYGAGEEVIGRTNVDIMGLAPGTRYTFRVSALNGGGWGLLSAPSSEIKTRGRKERSFGFVVTWIVVELGLVGLILAVVCFCWRKRQAEKEGGDHTYMELGVADDDLDALTDGHFSFGGTPERDERDLDNYKQLSFDAVLHDPKELVYFRDFCEPQGYLAHFRLYRTVEDYRQLGMLDRGQRARDIIRQYLHPDGDLYLPLHPMTLERIQEAVSDATPDPGLFDMAQAEAIAVLQLLPNPNPNPNPNWRRSPSFSSSLTPTLTLTLIGGDRRPSAPP